MIAQEKTLDLNELQQNGGRITRKTAVTKQIVDEDGSVCNMKRIITETCSLQMRFRNYAKGTKDLASKNLMTVQTREER